MTCKKQKGIMVELNKVGLLLYEKGDKHGVKIKSVFAFDCFQV